MIFANNTDEQKGKKILADKRNRLEIMTREIRLLYYNNSLYEKGVIGKREYEQINLAVIEKYGKKKSDESGFSGYKK